MEPVTIARAARTAANTKPGRLLIVAAVGFLIGILMLPMIVFTHIPATDPGGYAIYKQAAQALQDETGAGVNWQYFIVIDAVRKQQDFSNVRGSEIKSFFKSAFYYKKEIRTHEDEPCKSNNGKMKTCTKTKIRWIWKTRPLSNVLNRLGFTAKQRKQVTTMLKIDLNSLTPKNDDSGFTPNQSRLAWPVPGATHISSPFGKRSDPFTGKPAFHQGIDIAAASGTPVVAAEGGTVRISATSRTAGNWIVIENRSEETRYEHLDLRFVQTGDAVKRGQVIGSVGETGRATGPNLHFEVRENGKAVNPMSFFR